MFYVMFAEPVVFAEEHPADHLLARMKLTRIEPRGVPVTGVISMVSQLSSADIENILRALDCTKDLVGPQRRMWISLSTDRGAYVGRLCPSEPSAQAA